MSEAHGCASLRLSPLPSGTSAMSCGTSLPLRASVLAPNPRARTRGRYAAAEVHIGPSGVSALSQNVRAEHAPEAPPTAGSGIDIWQAPSRLLTAASGPDRSVRAVRPQVEIGARARHIDGSGLSNPAPERRLRRDRWPGRWSAPRSADLRRSRTDRGRRSDALLGAVVLASTAAGSLGISGVLTGSDSAQGRVSTRTARSTEHGVRSTSTSRRGRPHCRDVRTVRRGNADHGLPP